MKKIIALLLLSSCVLVEAVTSWLPGSVSAKPEKFEVRIRRVSFRIAGTQNWVTHIDEEAPMDIASADPGAAVGKLGVGKTLAPGTYDAMRFHIGTDFKINAQADMGGGVTAYTDDLNTGSVPITGIGTMCLASTTTGTATPTDKVIVMPTGSQAESEMESEGMGYDVIDGKVYFHGIMDFGGKTFTVTKKKVRLPKLQLDFDVTDAVDFYDTGSGIAVMPAGPGISLYLDDLLVFTAGRS